MAEKRTASKKAPAKKSAAKKTAARKRAASKSTSAARDSSATTTTIEDTPTKKSAAKKSPPRKQASAKASAEAPPRKPAGARMAGTAREVVLGLTGKTPESITGLQRSEDGWRVQVEVLEMERIPSTTDVMAIYEVTLDDEGELQGYSRVHRYVRGSAGDE